MASLVTKLGADVISAAPLKGTRLGPETGASLTPSKAVGLFECLVAHASEVKP